MTDPAAKLTPSWTLASTSLRLVKQHFEQIIFLFLLPGLVIGLGSILFGGDQLKGFTAMTNKQEMGLAILGTGYLWSLINFAPSMYFRIQIAAGKQPTLSECYRKGLPFFWRLVGLYLAAGLVLVAGFLLLIIPGIVLLVLFVRRYYLAAYYIVARHMDIGSALKQCRHDSQSVRPYIWGVFGIQILFGIATASIGAINAIGVVPGLLIGLVPLFVPALRFHEIQGANVSAHAPIEE
ncbi:MAG: hypothetical protein WA843_02115 [Candidatus Saccharimonadales bacterium]